MGCSTRDNVGVKAKVLRGEEEEERWGKLDPRLEVGAKLCKARRKQLGVRTGPRERILRLRGNMDWAVKPLRAWKLCSDPESHGGTTEVEGLVGADELVWVAA